MPPGEHVVSRSQPYPLRAQILLLIVIAILAAPNMGHPASDFLNASGVLLGLSLLLPAGFWLYYRLSRFEWILTDKRLVMVSGWLARSVHGVSLDEVNKISFRRSFLDRRLFSTGAIVVETGATAGAVTLNFVADDDPLRHAIETQVELRRRPIETQAELRRRSISASPASVGNRP